MDFGSSGLGGACCCCCGFLSGCLSGCLLGCLLGFLFGFFSVFLPGDWVDALVDACCLSAGLRATRATPVGRALVDELKRRSHVSAPRSRRRLFLDNMIEKRVCGK